MERDGLIRPQVLLHQQGPKAASIVISQSNAMASLAWALCVSVTALLIILFSIRYKQTLPSPGVLESSIPPLEFVSPANARVAEVFVVEGQDIAKGDVLAVLSKEVINGAGYNAEEASIAQLALQASLLEKERKLSEQIFLANRNQLKARISLLEEKLDRLNESVALGAARLKVSGANLKSLSQLLENSSVSKLQHDQQQLHYLDAAQNANNVELNKLEAESKLADYRLEKNKAQLEYFNTRATYDQQLGQIQHKIESLENSHLIRIVSNGDGIVTGMAIRKGMAVTANQYLFEVNRPNGALMVTLFVPSNIVGKLYTEQPLRLSFDGFPVNEYGYYNATISEIGGTPLDPRETPLPLQNPNQSVFKVTAELEQNYVDGPDTHPLRNGYGLTAHFVTENLSLLEFVLKPLISLRAKNQ